MQKAKAQLELKLTSTVSDNKKGFLKYTSSNRRSKENTRLILVEDGHLTINSEEVWRHSILSFALVFNNTDKLSSAQSPDLEDDFRNSDSPFV